MVSFTRLSWLEATIALVLFGYVGSSTLLSRRVFDTIRREAPSPWDDRPGLAGGCPMMDARQTELREMLEERRRVLQHQMLRKIRLLREAARVDPTGPVTDCSDDPAHEDIDFALAQMQAETMNKIHAALDRIASSEYGVCEGCHREIPMQRLRAVPFAILCRTCQERAEEIGLRARRSSPTGFARL